MGLNLDYPPDATPLDPDEAAGLLPSHISTHRQLNEWEAANILKAEAWLRGQTRADTLTLDFLRLLHEKMFDETWKWAGRFRTTEKNIGIDPAHIAPRLRDLCEDVKTQIATKSMPIDEIAARFHHRLVSIHPFDNGNGRHARLMADLLLLRNGAPRFTWGESHLVADDEVRRRYIAAMKAADASNYQPLMEFIRSGKPGA